MIGRYTPIADYAAIGNLRTVALVGRDGSIDWWPVPRLDRATVFAALLDDRRGGRFRIAPRGMGAGQQRYVRHTNVVETSFDADGGRLTVTDFMPLSGDIEGTGESVAAPEIVRIVDCEGGEVEVELEWAPRPDYGRARPSIELVDGGFLVCGGAERVSLGGLPPWASTEVDERWAGPVVRVRFGLSGGRRVALATRWNSGETHLELHEALERLRITSDTWRSWAHKPEVTDRGWAGRAEEAVIRSELVLKLLSQADSGAIAAAATTSLPEVIGGVRNWDYRFSWIRDASLAAQALFAAGHGAEAQAFLSWAEHVAMGRGGEPGVQIMYGLHGEREIGSRQLEHLEGYRGSRPVRIGNGAASQRQHDIFGELLDGAYALVRGGGELPPDVRALLSRVADHAGEALAVPDHGIWEMRNGPECFTYSQLMLWAGLDRAVILGERGVLDGDLASWRRQRARARSLVLERGYDAELGAFTQSFGKAALDAANLLIPLHELLPCDDARVQSTIDRTLERLSDDGLVYRYRTDDGLPGEEGAFVLCSFWLVDVLALSGRLDEASEIFERLAARANHVGLYPEQILPSTGEFLGNFPQAFSHIGFINSVIYLVAATGRRLPVPAPLGTSEHRAQVARHRRPDNGCAGRARARRRRVEPDGAQAARVRVFDDDEAMARAVTGAFRERAAEAVAARGRFAVALAGGQRPLEIYARLAGERGLPWYGTHLFWGDERCVPPDHAESNFRQIRDALGGRLALGDEHLHRIEVERGHREAARAYDEALARWFGGEPVFDLVHLGLGPDGHVASLFPGQAALDSDARVLATFPNPGLEPQVYRVTLGLAAINRARAVHVLVGEPDRSAAVARVLEQAAPLPASRIRGPEVVWFIGPDAARALARGRRR